MIPPSSACCLAAKLLNHYETLPAIDFKEDVLRVKRSQFRSVIPSLRSRASSERSEGSLSGERSFAALRMTIAPLRMTIAPLRMTKRDGLVFEMYCPAARPIPPPSSVPLVAVEQHGHDWKQTSGSWDDEG